MYRSSSNDQCSYISKLRTIKVPDFFHQTWWRIKVWLYYSPLSYAHIIKIPLKTKNLNMHTTPLIHITRGAWNWRSAQNLYASLYIFGRRRKKTKQMRERKRQRQRGIETEKVFPFLFTRWQEDKSMPVPRAAYSFPPTPSHSHTYTQENAPKQHKLTIDNSKWNNGCTEDPLREMTFS